MAYIFKPKFPKLHTVTVDGKPKGKPIKVQRVATRGPRKGQRIEVVKREPDRDEGGNAVMVESRTWAIEYTDATGRRRKATGYTDKGMTVQKAAALERGVMRQKEGVVDVDAGHSQTPVVKHIEAWLADLERGQRSPEYTRKLRPRVGKLAADLAWSVPGSIRPDRLTEWLGIQARAGASPRTVNHYLQAAVAFCNWCVVQGRIESNPLRSIGNARIVGPKVPRRALTVEELRRLVEVSPKRGTIYLTAALTGLRRAELAALEWGDVHLDDEQPHIALRASTTKSRRADTVAVNDELAMTLRMLRPSTCLPTVKVFAGGIPRNATLYEDLKLAGIERVRDGAKVDFHCLRVTHATMLATSGASIRETMEQMRHTDVRLTTKVYTDPRLLDLHRAVNSLPRIADTPSRETQAATGTYGPAKDAPKKSKSRMGSSLGAHLADSLAASAGCGLEWPKTPVGDDGGDDGGDEVPQGVIECVTPDPDGTYESECQPIGIGGGGNRFCRKVYSIGQNTTSSPHRRSTLDI